MDPYSFDTDKWIPKFPLADAPPMGERPETICPRGIAYVEQARAEIISKYGSLGPTVPMDLFVFGEGEPELRDMTKVGGVPYRPSGKPWPLTPAGTPMTFLAQYRFTESRDIVGEVPGDILLVFILDDDPWQGCPPEQFVYEWYPLGLTDLVRPSDVPPPSWEFFTGYGVRHRTVAYVEPPGEEFWKRVFPEEALNSYPRRLAIYNLCDVKGVKIGGVPYWWHPEHIYPDGGYDILGQFLFSLCSIGAPFDNDPWINRAEPIPMDEVWLKSGYLDFADGFVINYFMDKHGRIRQEFQPGG